MRTSYGLEEDMRECVERRMGKIALRGPSAWATACKAILPTRTYGRGCPPYATTSTRARRRRGPRRHRLARLRGAGQRLQRADRIDQAGAVLLALRLGGERGRGLDQDRAQLVRRDGRLALDQQRGDAA